MTAPATITKMLGKTIKASFEYNIGDLATSTSFTGDWIDLTEYPDARQIVVNKQGTASAGESLDIQGTHNQTKLFGVSRGDGTQNAATNTSSGAGMKTTGLPTGRYIRVKFDNGSTQQASDAVLTLNII